MKKSITSLLIIAALTGCATAPQGPQRPMTAAEQKEAQRQAHCGKRDTVGLVAGGALGGLLGHQVGKGKGNTLMTIGGALVGAVAGSAVANQTDADCAVR